MKIIVGHICLDRHYEQTKKPFFIKNYYQNGNLCKVIINLCFSFLLIVVKLNSETKFNAGAKTFYRVEQTASVISEDIPLPGKSSDIDFSSDSENGESAVEEQIVDDVEVLEEGSSSEHLPSPSESEDVDSERGGEEEMEDSSDVDTNNTPAKEKTPNAIKDSVAPIIIMQTILKSNKL